MWWGQGADSASSLKCGHIFVWYMSICQMHQETPEDIAPGHQFPWVQFSRLPLRNCIQNLCISMTRHTVPHTSYSYRFTPAAAMTRKNPQRAWYGRLMKARATKESLSPEAALRVDFKGISVQFHGRTKQVCTQCTGAGVVIWSPGMV